MHNIFYDRLNNKLLYFNGKVSTTCILNVPTRLINGFIFRDAKIAALEKTSQESEKMIAEARSDKLRQLDEVHAAQKKVTDLESK